MNSCQIHNDSNMQIDDEIHSLVGFAKERFKFQKPPSIFLKDDAENSEKILGKTGYYDPESFEIHIYTTGRHPKDVLRSIAHELVHHLQNEKGDLTNSGHLGAGYAQQNPKMREMERQAYEEGNLCLRDWEDLEKQKDPTIYKEGRSHQMSIKEWKNNELSDLLTNKWGFKMDLDNLEESKKETKPKTEKQKK